MLFAFRFRIRFSLHNRVSVEYTSLTRIFIRNASCRKYVSITEEIVGTTNWILYFLGWQYITQLVPIMDSYSLLVYRSKLITYRDSQITFTISIPVGGIKLVRT